MLELKDRIGVWEWLMLLVLSVLWGGSFFFIEIAVTSLPVFTIVSLRVALAALALWAFALAKGLSPPRSLHIWLSFLVMGLLNNAIPFSLIVWGQTEISSGLASILNGTTPLFTFFIAGLLLHDEPITLKKASGVAVGFFGVVVIVGPGLLDEIGILNLAQLAALGGALSYAFAGVYGRRFSLMGIDPVIIAAGQVTMSSMVLIPISLMVDAPVEYSIVGFSTWAAIGGLAVLSTAIAYVLYFRILASVGATNLLLVTFLIPVTAIFLGITVLGETLQISEIVGMGFIAIGLLTIDGRLFTRNESN
ncbi:MAG: DMT family transporter [Gammaproteobacteria bacterium]|nr:DMT family transporter [Gammaproteobacteria bacterium]